MHIKERQTAEDLVRKGLNKQNQFTVDWIGKKANKTSYGFNLLYRASRDGNTSLAFHQKCDNKGANIVVVKIKGTEQIVGGFNPFGWEGNDYKFTKDSFIFSFVDRTNLQTAKVV
ncbi:12270_t:CDS:2 [Funneliformis geosporum]|nr:12270_t:CDS:2 [Funneliformis geosporum]